MDTHPLYAATINHYLSVFTILGLIFIVIFFFRAIYLIVYKKVCPIAPFVTSYIFPISFLLTFVGVGLSLFYSEALKYVPCDLCWYQRIFLYPQMFMIGYAWYKKDTTVFRYTTVLSVIGAVIALYHHFLQIGFDLMKPCSDAPFAVDCAKPSFVEFGFVTFPLMSFVLFGFMIILTVISSVLAKRTK